MTKIEEISAVLREKGHVLLAAESFTGGGIASKFVSLQGASDIFAFSAVCYSNEAKEQILGVKKSTISAYGAVSKETVSEMLDGLKSLGLGDIYVATSGNAGPTAEKEGEVGVFYVGAMLGEKKLVQRFFCGGDREAVIGYGIDKALDLLGELLME